MTQQHKSIAVMASRFLLLIGCCTTTPASDIEIYKSATKGEVVITMMLDTSGSMDLMASSVDYPPQKDTRGPWNLKNRLLPCDLPQNERFMNGSLLLNQAHPDPQRNYRINYCMTQTGQKYLDRMSRLKDALYTLATSNAIDPLIKIGIGTYPYYDARTRLLDDDRKDTNRRAYMRISAEAWGQVGSIQRSKVLKFITEDLRGNGGTPTAAAYAEAAAYMLGTTTGDSLYSGINFADRKYSSNLTQGSGWSKRYISPITNKTSPECNGQGIYFLTDGVPQSAKNSLEPTLMSAALQTYEENVRRGSQGIQLSSGISDRDRKFKSSWKEIGFFARELNNSAQLKRLFRAPSDFRIRTAVVGFGSDFDINPKIKQVLVDPKTQRSRSYYNCHAIGNVDAKNACNWGEKSVFSNGSPTISGVGGYGEGGFYSAQSTDELIQSIVKFVDETKPDFDPLIMGSPTIPLDRLNPLQLHPFGYYATFIPTPASSERLWQGNLNKYPIYNGELMDADRRKSLIKSSGEIDQTAQGLWGQGGMKALLPLGTRPTTQDDVMHGRRLWTNRQLDAKTQVPQSAATLKAVSLATVLGIGADHDFVNDPDKNYWLNLLGYPVAVDAEMGGIVQLPQHELRQMGAVLHSKPILITQQGKVADVDGKLGSQNREDYLLFGSTQGLLHVVDQQGQEVFAFVPNEMLAAQKQAFLAPGSTSGGSELLFYGVDATWTAHTQYVSTADGGLSVQDAKRTGDESQQRKPSLMDRGLQWVYGGLRMGGKSYYALDLTEILQPKLKFQIDPVNARIINTQGQTQVPELQYMGQSWSKPTLGYVNWQGQKKLVMFVGGGYDATGEVQCAASRIGSSALPSQTRMQGSRDADAEALVRYNNKGYECPNYQQHNAVGAGVYMFDADNGSLLWWSSVHAQNQQANGTAVQATPHADLQYSVVSQINALDRNNDGLVDTLYFADLAGQAFRVDIDSDANAVANVATNTAATPKPNFAKRVVRLLNVHREDGLSPRFYGMPSFSVHQDAQSQLFGVMALSSGNTSSPLADASRSAQDGVFVIFDRDVARADLYRTTALQETLTFQQLPMLNLSAAAVGWDGEQSSDTAQTSGWWSPFSSIQGDFKGLNEIFAIDHVLYANVYNKNGQGIGGGCGARVVGDSYLFQYCLPFGRCNTPLVVAGQPNRMKIGAGILGTGLAKGYTNADGSLSVALNRQGKNSSNCRSEAYKHLPECQLFETQVTLKNTRWYERRSKI